jgi:Fur family iron response transcriptional regulator
MHYTRDNMAGLLRGHDINPTHQRIEIAHALFSRQEHLSADQVMAIVNTRHSETSKATVYNTLRLFLEKGLVREVIVDPSKVFFDPNTSPHHHLYEVDSGKLSDIDAEHVQISGLPLSPVDETGSHRPHPARRPTGCRHAVQSRHRHTHLQRQRRRRAGRSAFHAGSA